MVSAIERARHLPGFRTDHSSIEIQLECNKDFKRGPGFWKMNDSLLYNIDNLNKLNQQVDATIEKCKLYRKDIKWENTKECLVRTCKTIAIENATKRKERIAYINEQLLEQCDKIVSPSVSNVKKEIAFQEIDRYENELNRHIQYSSQGARVRSRSVWYEKGERNDKYFFGLEKTKYQNKTLHKIICEDGSVTRNERKILNEQAKFYRKLYTSNPKVKFVLENETEIKYSDADKEAINAPFSFEDFTAALKSMKKGKVAGNDGLTVSVYIVMWNSIGKILWDAANYCKEQGALYRSGHKGVISLIPKKGKSPELLKNWHPLMLLNTDHKIITKMLTNRLKIFLKKVIGTQQTGYVPGRFIGLTIRKLINVLQYVEKEQIPAVLLNIDYYKCFDSMEHTSMIEELRYFNVGEQFISWIKMLYCNFEFCVINNGRWSKYYKQKCGVHQGSALSGPLFLYVAEILAININKKPMGFMQSCCDLIIYFIYSL